MKAIKLMLTIMTCLVSSQLSAAEGDGPKFDLEHLLTEKKAIIKETVQFTEKENQAFWPLYDEYMKTYIKIINRRIALMKGLLEDNEAISDKQAKTIVDEHFAIRSEHLKSELSMLKRLRKILPEKKVLKFLQLEEKIVIGFLCQFAENLPLVK